MPQVRSMAHYNVIFINIFNGVFFNQHLNRIINVRLNSVKIQNVNLMTTIEVLLIPCMCPKPYDKHRLEMNNSHTELIFSFPNPQ